ncbi:MAG: N-acetylmuramoyl-L-alanine amidase [Paracoccaceae bacterium]
MSRFVLILICMFWLSPVAAQELTALARVLPDSATLRDEGGAVELKLSITQAVPYRIFTLENPWRMVLDFNELDWSGVDRAGLNQSQAIASVHMGAFRPGWSRMVLELQEPLELEVAGLATQTDQSAEVLIRLIPISAEAFSENAGAPDGALFAPETGVELVAAKRRQTGENPLIVVLDPGHGGIDPGAESGGTIEADLMLTFAKELQELLIRAGNFEVVLTRDDDVFVPLEARVSLARKAGADVFLSLHADALVEGRASGATVYTLSESASDIASQKLAERHGRGDLLAGVDLKNQDDVIATVLMDMARIESAHRANLLADALVVGLKQTVGMHKRPKLSAGFSVLKAADIPSVLIELGFLSSPRDLEHLLDSAWRAKASEGILLALQSWAIADAAEALLLRQ